MRPEIDEPSGQRTTGHEWDGIKELNTPVPISISVWMWVSIALCIILWLLYPAFPLLNSYTKGLLGYSSRNAVSEKVAEGALDRQAARSILGAEDISILATLPQVRAQFGAAAEVLFRDNCAACHGRDLKGQPGFPNLTDDHWLWSGQPEEITTTLRYGINHLSDDGRYAEMPAFGRDGLLEKSEINSVIDYVLSLSGADHDAQAATIGAGVFEANCAACHGDAGVGGLGNGAPSLSDDVWIYGGSRQILHNTLRNGRAGVMPGWADRLGEDEMNLLTLYVLWAGQDYATD